jgi:tRNA(Ile)-lysidine synthase
VTPFVQAVEAAIRRHAMLAGGERVLVAVSGGADSVALLHALSALAPAWRLALHVLHVDHQLRPESGRDADFVRALSARLGVGCEVARVTVGRGSSPEAQARAARHSALTEWADRLGAFRIALGHTRDDQAETVLMRVLEGAGPRGLAGIAPVRGRIVRPLLTLGRHEVVAELEAQGLSWIEDPSNRDPRFFRNRVRHAVLPQLATACDLDVVAALTRTAARMREAVDALDARASAELDRLARPGVSDAVFSRAALGTLPDELAANVLRLGAARLGSRAPLRAWAHRGLARVLAEPTARRPFRFGGVTVEVSGDWLRLSSGADAPLGERLLQVPGRTALPEIGRSIEARLLPARDYVLPREPSRAAFDADLLPAPVRVRPRGRGDRLRAFAGGERRVKSLFIDAKVPAWERDRIPLVEAGGEVIWIAGLRRGALAPLSGATRRVLDLALVSSSEEGELPATMRLLT